MAGKRRYVRSVEPELLTPAQFLALPAQADGTVLRVLVDAAAGVIWTFRFRAASASAYKWELLDGAKLSAQNTGPVAFAFPATYGWNVMPSGPVVTAPLAGEFEMDWAVVMLSMAAGGVGDVRFRPSPMSTGNFSSAGWSNSTAGPINGKGSTVQAATAGQQVAIAGASPVANASVTVYERIIQIRPVRVTGP
jgi:hypothetical protein